MIDYQSLQSALATGGLYPRDIVAGSLQRCPVDGDRGGKKSGAYRLFDDDLPMALWWNWKTSAMGIWVSDQRPQTAADRVRQRQVIEQAKRERHEAQLEQWAANTEYLARMWGRTEPLTPSCAAGIYLQRRGLDVPNTDALRFSPAMDYWEDTGKTGTYPAMLAAVTDSSGRLVAIHRTYLTADGNKAPVPTVKKLTRTAGTLTGASIKIGAPVPRPDGRLGLGVAEGIETAIAAYILGGVPTWPCVSAHGLESFESPPDVHYLYVFGDHDESGVGQKAANSLGKQVARTGLVARILIPESPGDWNDELIARRAAA